MNIFARFINSFEKPPVSKTPEEKDKDSKEWKEHSGVQAEMAEEQEKAEEKKKSEQSKSDQEKEWKEHFGDQAKIVEEQEEAEQIKNKQEKEWHEHFGVQAEIAEGQEKTGEAVKEAETKKETEPPKVPERELLQKTELDPEYVLGKDRANLAKELGERIRNKSAFETKEKKKTSFSELLEKLGAERTLKILKKIEERKEGKKGKEVEVKKSREPKEKQERAPFILKNFLEELDMKETLKIVKALEKFLSRGRTERTPFNFKKFLKDKGFKKTLEILKKFERKEKQVVKEQKTDVKLEEKPLEEQLQDLLGNLPVHKESVKNEPEAGAEKRRLTIEELKNKTKEELQELRNKASYEWANAYLKYEKVLSENPDVVKARQAVEKASGTDEWDSAYKTANKIEEEFVSKNPKIAKLKEEYDAIGDYVRSIDTAESKLQEQKLKNN